MAERYHARRDGVVHGWPAGKHLPEPGLYWRYARLDSPRDSRPEPGWRARSVMAERYHARRDGVVHGWPAGKHLPEPGLYWRYARLDSPRDSRPEPGWRA